MARYPTMMTGQGHAMQDGSLGQVFRDGVLGQAGSFRDGSLGASQPRPQSGELNYRMRMLRNRLSIRGLGASQPRPQKSTGQRWMFLRNLKNRLGIRGLGEGEADVSVTLSPTVKVIGLVTIAGLGAYGIYRLTSKK